MGGLKLMIVFILVNTDYDLLIRSSGYFVKFC